MRIYKMTATFGKLERSVLELKPGLNILTAPNEWGKSTWCAFLLAMFYGLDTRAKTTKNVLADKERYAPWSGAPMEGRIDLEWQGRDLTIERRTGRRVPMGEFAAYETKSGLPVPELTAANCGLMLLGVERSVFQRAGFIRHGDLPVTQDEALRRRLNALVTTGDDSGAAERLAQKLKELKHRCRYNRSGLLPQAESKREELENQLAELERLESQSEKLQSRLEELGSMIAQLENHRSALAYAKMEADIAKVHQTRKTAEAAQQNLQNREAACEGMPALEEAQLHIRELRSFRDQWNAIQEELQQMPAEPVKPWLEEPFSGMTPEAAREMVRRDSASYAQAAGNKLIGILGILGLLGLVTAMVLGYFVTWGYGVLLGIAGLGALLGSAAWKRSRSKTLTAFQEKYHCTDCTQWGRPIEAYEQAMAAYEEDREAYLEVSEDLEVRLMVLRKRRETLCGGRSPESLLEFWQEVQEKQEALLQARREAERAWAHFEMLRAMVKPVQKPEQPDALHQSEEETAALLTECASEQQRLHNRLGQYQGRMSLLGSREDLLRQRAQAEERIAGLEAVYEAVTIAQNTLSQARAELQRRFAPRITSRAQEILSGLTNGRYHSLTMGEDLSLRAGAGEETTLHEALWRSDGTIDQLYLALRLAVAEELTPEAPLILDDALVRFDDRRMRSAVALLRKMAEHRQVICFTCQEREAKAEN
ncbi:MAG: AAA family ATPase [Oscillospiraceae bacterium]|nr:AAA family ATPase [Oscillospiraceae bacterium]